MMSTSIDIAGETLKLLPEKAVWWPAQQALLLSDPHFGKVTHFRKHGLAVPPAARLGTLRRLELLVVRHRPKVVYVLGDLFHSSVNEETHDVKLLATRNEEVAFHVILGNHDRAHEPLIESLGWVAGPREDVGPFTFVHEPMASTGRYVLAGHVHPAVRLIGKGRQRVKRPCFHFGREVGVLPAFGEFTGSHIVQPIAGDVVGVCLDDEVWVIREGQELESGPDSF